MTVPTPSALPESTAFFSYSHSSPEYVQRVADLAAELASHGVRVVFDQWDLREGQDLHSFMEQAVNNDEVTHVLILCDPVYAEKANERRGGVGTETLIISPAVYRDVQQKRIIPVIMERDADDHVRVPTYLDGRAYIDLSTEERAVDGYEQLVRALYDRPARTRPPLGQPPAFLDEAYVPLQTAGAARIARAALLGHRSDVPGRFADYLDRLADVIAAEEITDIPQSAEELTTQVLVSIDRLHRYRDEFLTLCRDVARYAGNWPELYDRLHEFFERLASIRLQHRQVRFRALVETENLAFVGWELMLGTTAVLLQQSQFNGLARLLRPLFVRSRNEGAGALRSIDVLEPGFPLIQAHNEGESRRWSEPAAQMLRERLDESSLEFEALMEADLLLWYRTVIDREVEGVWTPRTLAYAESLMRLPLFARARAAAYFERLAPALGVKDRAEFISRFREISEDRFLPIGRAIGGRAGYARLMETGQEEG